MLSNFNNEELLIEKFEENFSGLEKQEDDRRDVEGVLDGVAQLLVDNEDDKAVGVLLVWCGRVFEDFHSTY